MTQINGHKKWDGVAKRKSFPLSIYLVCVSISSIEETQEEKWWKDDVKDRYDITWQAQNNG